MKQCQRERCDYTFISEFYNIFIPDKFYDSLYKNTTDLTTHQQYF